MIIKRILHPTDFTPGSGPAYQRAVALARHFDAELHLLHVTEVFGTDPIRGAFDVRLDEESFYRELWATADRQMTDLALAAESDGIALKRVHSRGQKPAPVILEYAREQEIDLIVIGTHGRRGFRRMIAGSVAMEVVRKALVPVMTVGPAAPTDAELFDRIMVPVDFSDHARTALRFGRSLAAELQSELSVLHVIEKPAFPAFYEASVEMFYGSMENMIVEARQELERINADVDDLPLIPSFEIRVGHAVDEILRAAREARAGLIVVSTHGATGIPKFFLGSVSERVIRAAEVPVLRIKTAGAGSPATAPSAEAATNLP